MTLLADKCKRRSCNGAIVNGLFNKHGEGCGGVIAAEGWLSAHETGLRLAHISSAEGLSPEVDLCNWSDLQPAWISSHSDPWRSLLRTAPCGTPHLPAGGFLLYMHLLQPFCNIFCWIWQSKCGVCLFVVVGLYTGLFNIQSNYNPSCLCLSSKEKKIKETFLIEESRTLTLMF